MKAIRIALYISVLGICAWPQIAASQAAAEPSSSGASQTQKQSNAASATQDTSAISGDQVTKPAGAKGTTVIGCLGSANADGNLMLNSMQYRSGVEVLGPPELKSAEGQKVKLTGVWVPNPKASAGDKSDKKETRRFQATSLDVLAEKCPPPAETTPTSKKKQQQQKAAAKANSASTPQ
jgi:hypothetical protein